MRPTLWAIPRDAEPIRYVQSRFRDSGTLVIEEESSFDSAIERCGVRTAPTAILTVVNQQVPGLLELLIALDSAMPSVPLFSLIQGRDERDLPIGTGGSLNFVSTRRAIDRISSLEAATATPVKDRESLRRGADYLLSAVLCQRSLSLGMVSETGVETQIDVVGGDIWNAYARDLDSMDAIEAMLYEPMVKVTTRPLHTIPGERQVKISGPQALGSATRRLQQGASMTSEDDLDQEFGTQEVGTEAILADLEEAANTDRLEDNDSEELFKQFLTEGIKASLARDYKRAAESFEAALKIKPGDTKAEFNLKQVQRRL